MRSRYSLRDREVDAFLQFHYGPTPQVVLDPVECMKVASGIKHRKSSASDNDAGNIDTRTSILLQTPLPSPHCTTINSTFLPINIYMFAYVYTYVIPNYIPTSF